MKKNNLTKINKIGLFIAVTVLMCNPAFADISSDLQSVVSKIKGPINIVVGILGIVGGFNVFYQYKSGNEKAKQNMIMLVLGLTVWFLLPSIIKVFIPTFVW